MGSGARPGGFKYGSNTDQLCDLGQCTKPQARCKKLYLGL